ncbi:MAG: hypothetical protein JWR02_1324 [Mucilaginibacter sp.]|nr:hypothetical protein [Mucilaginibacter sp.]
MAETHPGYLCKQTGTKITNLALWIFMNKQIIITASVICMLAVIAVDIGAHSLQGNLSARNLEVWRTAVQYQFYHVFAMLFLATLGRIKSNFISASYYLFTFGIVLFSGSLYLLACRGLLNWGWLPIIGPVTPIGGLLFIIGWLMLGLAAFRTK